MGSYPEFRFLRFPSLLLGPSMIIVLWLMPRQDRSMVTSHLSFPSETTSSCLTTWDVSREQDWRPYSSCLIGYMVALYVGCFTSDFTADCWLFSYTCYGSYPVRVFVQCSIIGPFHLVHTVNDYCSKKSPFCMHWHSLLMPLTIAIRPVTDATWQSPVLDSESPVLVEFWAHGAAPAKLSGPWLMSWQSNTPGSSSSTRWAPMRALGLPQGTEPTLMISKGGGEGRCCHWGRYQVDTDRQRREILIEGWSEEMPLMEKSPPA